MRAALLGSVAALTLLLSACGGRAAAPPVLEAAPLWQPAPDAHGSRLHAPLPPVAPWAARVLGAVVVPIGKEVVPYDLALLAARVVGKSGSEGPDWPAYVRQASLGRAVFEARVLPWVLAPRQGLSMQQAAQVALDAADAAVDLSRYADEAGTVRAVVVPVAAGLAGVGAQQIVSMPVQYVARHATQQTTVKSVIFMGVPATAKDLRKSPARPGTPNLAVLARVLGVGAIPLVVETTHHYRFSPEARAALGWITLVAVDRTQELVVPTRPFAEVAELPEAPVVYKVPVVGAKTPAYLAVEPFGRGQLKLARYRISATGMPQFLMSEHLISSGPQGMTMPLTERAQSIREQQDRQLTIAWEAQAALVQVNLSSTGVERQRAAQQHGKLP